MEDKICTFVTRIRVVVGPIEGPRNVRSILVGRHGISIKLPILILRDNRAAAVFLKELDDGFSVARWLIEESFHEEVSRHDVLVHQPLLARLGRVVVCLARVGQALKIVLQFVPTSPIQIA
ncbi:hypothetical protein [Sorangium sp. So ce1000]|uniref:hypothetical protein n=1 Tax=Sorangium sp. So ce1000 TaxID=3133325 RepID=UPI003F61A93C